MCHSARLVRRHLKQLYKHMVQTHDTWFKHMVRLIIMINDTNYRGVQQVSDGRAAGEPVVRNKAQGSAAASPHV